MLRIVAIYLSPGHNFFGHHGKPPGENEVLSVREVECVAGSGLRGDRFFDHKTNYEGQVTFFSKEVFDALCQRFDIWDKPVSALRRNILVAGVDLNELVGKEFEVQGVRFFGTEEAKPCYWMNQAFAPHAEQFLRGQGGLRARVLSDGTLHCDAAADAAARRRFPAGRKRDNMSGITAVLLAGGKSSRMGTDKAFIELDGVPSWRRQLAKLRALNPSQVMISSRPEQKFPDNTPAQIIHDEDADAGPLGGIVTALRHASQQRVLVLGIDLPLLPVEFLQGLCDYSFLDSGVLYRNETHFEPLAALYPKSILRLAEEHLRSGQLSLQELVGAAVADGGMQALGVPIAARRYFTNINTIEDLANLGQAGDLVDPGDTPSGPLSDSGAGAVATPIIRCEAINNGDTSLKETNDHVATEAPLELRVEGKSVAVVMRTPGHDEELALGFLISEGVLTSPDDVFEVTHCPSQDGGQEGNVLDVLLRNPDAAQLQNLTRHVFSSSSCGICGKATLASVFVQFPKVENPLSVDASIIFGLPVALRHAQETFDTTGGLHASAVFDRFGNLLMLREDVGRHNALDKVLGSAFSSQILPLHDHILLVSGRISFELMQKSLAAGIPIIAGISAPSSLAVDFARGSGQTLCGFLRDGRMNIYANAERIVAG